MKKYLIVYYSRTGTAKKTAEKLKALLGEECDVEEVIDIKKRNGIVGYVAAIKDAINDNITKIAPVKLLPRNYNETIVVTPVWAGKTPDALRTYLSMYKSDIKTLKLVTCAKTSTGDKLQKDVFMRFSLKAKVLVSLKEKDVLTGSIDESLKVVKGD